ncbi:MULTISPECIES: caspase family protein [Prevotellaceae]|uniref:caspase family protein n=2 Tax=Prevotellaceae TaxID=171552 RepID=UPI001F36A58A|nr:MULTISPECIES: caspase family protein [Prevotellaceae]MCF2644227.1 caspase family protein [Leyella stercorea]MCI6130164.1 caspase family protein [Prevotella sp.]MCI7371021.1 caspase family protein [Prevotella sp.]MDD6198211.1 caspase family protein [Prevotella sp.]
MKKLLSLLFCVALALSANAQKTYAIITGVSNYEGNDHDLAQSSKDAKSIAALYKEKNASVTLFTSKYATRDNIIAQIRKVAKVATASDRVVFSYSGHGAPNILCTYTTGNMKMLSYAELFKELNKCLTKDIVVYIDACFSGSAASSAVGTKALPVEMNWRNMVKSNPRYILFLSSRESETSAESGLVGAGFFTRALIKGLRGKSDVNADRNVTVMELFRYIYKDVLLHSDKKQHPQLVAPKTLHDTVLMKW